MYGMISDPGRWELSSQVGRNLDLGPRANSRIALAP